MTVDAVNDIARAVAGFGQPSLHFTWHLWGIGHWIGVSLAQHRDNVGWFRRRTNPQSATGQEPKLFTMLHQGVRLGVPAKEQEALKKPESWIFVPELFTRKGSAFPNSG